jgi:hypothetical protein
MRKLIAVALVAVLMVGVAAPMAYADTATNVALGLASFAVFNQIVGELLFPPRVVYAQPVVYTQPAPVVIERPVPVYRPVVVATPPPPPVHSNVVYYPNGRYVLRGDGVYTAHQWVWVPSVQVLRPAPPPPPLY